MTLLHDQQTEFSDMETYGFEIRLTHTDGFVLAHWTSIPAVKRTYANTEEMHWFETFEEAWAMLTERMNEKLTSLIIELE